MISGIISAKTNNTIGVAGIAGGNNSQGVKIMPLNIAPTNTTINSDQYSADKFSLAKAIKYAAHKGAKIITITATFAPNTYSPLVNEAINEAVDLYDCIIICASGNGSGSINQVHYPANNAKVIAVGAYVPINQGYSNTFTHGQELDFTALAMQSNSQGQYFGLAPNNQYYQAAGGTSIATAQISGMIALILSNYECIPKDDLIDILKSNSIIPNTSQCVPNSENWCDKFGYGTPNLSQIRDELNNRYLNNHNIINNTTISDLRFANNDIIINSDKKLTITGKLVMKNGTKILVQPRGKLEIINGGEITSNCEWIGVEVYGDSDPYTSQNISNDGAVYINTGGKLSFAKYGVKTIGEGILYTDSAFFYNNYISVYISPMYNHVTSEYYAPNKTTIKSTTFEVNKHLKNTIYNNASLRKSYNSFIKIDNSKYLVIDENSFKDNLNSLSGIAINAYRTELVIRNNLFNNVYNGIESFSLYSFRKNSIDLNQIIQNSFTNVDRSIGLYGLINPHIINNNIQLSLTSNKTLNNGVLEQNWGIAVKNSRSNIRLNNIIGAEDFKGYGTYINNDDIFKVSGDYLIGNTFENLSTGSQFEFYQLNTKPYCNSYLGMFDRAWSISPNFSDKFTFPDVGNSTGFVAGNLFFDVDINKERHIKSRRGFTYNSSTDLYSEPTDISNGVFVSFHPTNNVEICETFQRYNPCDFVDCNTNDLIDLLSIEADEHNKSVIIDKIIQIFHENNDLMSIRNFLLSQEVIDSNLNEAIVTLIEIGEYGYANDLIQNYPTLTQTDLDFKYILNLYLNIKQNHVALDSLDQSILLDLEYLCNNNNSASYYAHQILKFAREIEFDQNPSLWDNSVENSIYLSNNNSKNKNNIYNSHKLLLFPNPILSGQKININVLNYDGIIDNIKIYNSIGILINDIDYNKKNNIILDIINYTPGIYYISTKLNNGIILNEKFTVND